MESILLSISLALIVFFVGFGVLYQLFQVLSFPVYFAKYILKFNRKYTPAQKKKILVVLERISGYYSKLDNKGKSKFMKRVLRLMNSFNFYGEEGLIINTEIKAVICTAIAKVTFGLAHYDLYFHNNIVLYPDVFKLGPERNYMRGAATKKNIYFSFKDVIAGFKNPNDGINLAIHEIAHAFKINYIEGSYELEKPYQRWKQVAGHCTQNLVENPHGFFRKSAFTNYHEFFAVTLENFFERPEMFKNYLPELYFATCNLMNQNPLNKHQNYNI